MRLKTERGSPWKPWYLWRPEQLAVRCWRSCRQTPAGYRPILTAWGNSIVADPATTIGRSLWTTAIHDLAVSEAFVRLIEPGAVVIDAGAHVGYMSVLAAVAAGPRGRVLAFEPHPTVFAMLQRTLELFTDPDAAPVVAHNAALGAAQGDGTLVTERDFERNDGLARVGAGATGDGSIAVKVETVDDVLNDGQATVLKLDVEGHELQVLRGALRALEARRVDHVIFEDFEVGASDVRRLLERAGYQVFSIGWSLRRLSLRPASQGSLAKSYEAPSYLATLRPQYVLDRCATPGWRVLRKHLGLSASRAAA